MQVEASTVEPTDTAPCGHLGLAKLPSSTSAPGDARRWVRKVLSWLDEDTLDRVDIVVSELTTNAHLHTGTAEIWVHVTSADGLIRVEITDDGSPTLDERDASYEGGRGRGIVKQLVAELSGSTGKTPGITNTVWFEFKAADRCA